MLVTFSSRLRPCTFLFCAAHTLSLTHFLFCHTTYTGSQPPAFGSLASLLPLLNERSLFPLRAPPLHDTPALSSVRDRAVTYTLAPIVLSQLVHRLTCLFLRFCSRTLFGPPIGYLPLSRARPFPFCEGPPSPTCLPRRTLPSLVSDLPCRHDFDSRISYRPPSFSLPSSHLEHQYPPFSPRRLHDGPVCSQRLSIYMSPRAINTTPTVFLSSTTLLPGSHG